MNSNQFSKLLLLIRRTGDRAVVPDSESDELFVVMDSGNYERLLSHTKSVRGLNENEMMEKINRDISLWRAQNNSDSLEWYEGSDDGYDRDNDLASDKNYFADDFNELDDEISEDDFFQNLDLDTKPAVGSLDLEDNILDDDINDPDDGEDNRSLNEETNFDDLERDGFVVEGEENDSATKDEPLYFEHNDLESGSERVELPEMEVKDVSDSRFEGAMMAKNEESKAESKNKDFLEESLDNIIDDDNEFLEEPV